MNVASYQITLPIGTVLVNLEAVEIVGYQSESASVESEEDAESECASVLLYGVDSTVPTETKEALSVLLRQFAATFSTGENDFGRANAERHRVNTSSSRPFRQALRRHPTLMVEATDAQIDAILKADLIEPAQWSGRPMWSWSEIQSDENLRVCFYLVFHV